MQAVSAADAVPPISPEAAWSLLQSGLAVAVDVREPSEVAVTGKVPGALAIPRGLLPADADPRAPTRHPELSPERPVILYCAGGARAAVAGRMLKEFGFGTVYNLGGIKDWLAAGLPVESA